jgi:hypothetical protein
VFDVGKASCAQIGPPRERPEKADADVQSCLLGYTAV